VENCRRRKLNKIKKPQKNKGADKKGLMNKEAKKLE
jgi:hypothetical protein